MITIDLSQRANLRDAAPMISFRRTDADRRPARRVIRPQDGPGDMERRFALSEERKAALAQKTRQFGAETYREEMDLVTAHNRRLALSALVKRSPLTMMEIALEIGVDTGAASVVVAQMGRDGLISREKRGPTKSPVLVTPTVEGLQWLEQNQ